MTRRQGGRGRRCRKCGRQRGRGGKRKAQEIDDLIAVRAEKKARGEPFTEKEKLMNLLGAQSGQTNDSKSINGEYKQDTTLGGWRRADGTILQRVPVKAKRREKKEDKDMEDATNVEPVEQMATWAAAQGYTPMRAGEKLPPFPLTQTAAESVLELPSKAISLVHRYTTKPMMSLLSAVWQRKEDYINSLPPYVKLAVRGLEIGTYTTLFIYLYWPLARFILRKIWEWINPMGQLHTALGTKTPEEILMEQLRNANLCGPLSCDPVAVFERLAEEDAQKTGFMGVINQMWGYVETNPEVISEFDKAIRDKARVDLTKYMDANPHLMYGKVKEITNPGSSIPFVDAFRELKAVGPVVAQGAMVAIEGGVHTLANIFGLPTSVGEILSPDINPLRAMGLGWGS